MKSKHSFQILLSICLFFTSNIMDAKPADSTKKRLINTYISTNPVLGISVNAEYVIPLKGRSLILMRAGLLYQTEVVQNRTQSQQVGAWGVPLGISYLIGNKRLNHFGEFGLSYHFFATKSAEDLPNLVLFDRFVHVGTLYLGYRYQPNKGGFFCKAGINVPPYIALAHYANSTTFPGLNSNGFWGGTFSRGGSVTLPYIGIEIGLGWTFVK